MSRLPRAGIHCVNARCSMVMAWPASAESSRPSRVLDRSVLLRCSSGHTLVPECPLSPDEQAAARRVLLRLAGPGEGTAVTRRRVALAELEPARDQHTAQALKVLTARRLLTA